MHDLPVLNIQPSQGEDALLQHKLTPDELCVFTLFDSATGRLPADADPTEYHELVAELGEQFDLTPEQSIAFWTRTTFMMFEQ